MERWVGRRVVIVGAGAVGSTFAYALAQSGVADEIVLVDANRELALGQALDLGHGAPFVPSLTIRVGDRRDYRDAHVVVIAAGAGQRPGESRLDLVERNSAIVAGIVDEIAAEQCRGVLVVATNPVDALTYVAQQRSGWPSGRVIGSGTVLDSARLRYLLGARCGVDVKNVHAYVLGEHGDSEIIAWSLAHVGGVPIDQYCRTCLTCGEWDVCRAGIEQEVRDSAYHIISYKGATWFAIGLALVRVVESILRGTRSALTVSSVLSGEYGIRDTALSVPCIVSEHGVERVVEAPLAPEELEALRRSADVVRSALARLAPSTDASRQ